MKTHVDFSPQKDAEGFFCVFSFFLVCLFGHCHTQTEANINICVYMSVLLCGSAVVTEVSSSFGMFNVLRFEH